MTITETRPETRPFVEAIIRYTDRASDGAMLNSQEHDSSTFKLEPHKMRVYNARAHGPKLSFDRNGFTILKHETDIDFRNKADVDARYYPEAASMVRELTGASEVLVFLDVIRSETRGEGAEPAHNAHVDFNEQSIHRWVKLLRPESADALLKKRLVNINLWRPIKPVERMPLAICDATSVERRDLLNIVIGGRDPVDGYGGFAGFNLAYNPEHRWYYYPLMQPGEVMAFRLFDSDASSPHLTAHTAFEDPSSAPNASKRISHEIRTIAVLD